jgi:hypothetical protein
MRSPYCLVQNHTADDKRKHSPKYSHSFHVPSCSEFLPSRSAQVDSITKVSFRVRTHSTDVLLPNFSKVSLLQKHSSRQRLLHRSAEHFRIQVFVFGISPMEHLNISLKASSSFGHRKRKRIKRKFVLESPRTQRLEERNRKLR